ncbi:MAG: molybdopterin-dependent oxidoreductase [Candidatus Saganbacteria bacterium]|nr:molybdopterin-dependent oxidoreductase [Candidatus Saganbacteria bacterium]
MAVEEKKTRCMFCSMGCGLIIKTERGMPIDLEYDTENPINEGSLCPRGNYMYELLDHKGRISAPLLRLNGSFKETTPANAYSLVSDTIKGIKEKYGGNSIGILMSGESFNEDVYTGARFARDLIGTSNFDIGLLQEDFDILEGESDIKIATPSDIEQSEIILIIGDALTKSPVLSKRIMRAKYQKKGTKIIVIDGKRSNTSWFATTHLMPLPGEEAELLAEILKFILLRTKKKMWEDLKKKFGALEHRASIPESVIGKTAFDILEAKKGVVILSSRFADNPYLGDLSRLIVEAHNADFKFLPLYTAGNALGAYRIKNALMKDKISAEEMIELAGKKKLRALLVFGEDFYRLLPGDATKKAIQNLDFLFVSSMFLGDAAKAASVVFPLASFGEKQGTTQNFFGETVKMLPVSKPLGFSASEFSILSELSKRISGKEIISFAEASLGVDSILGKEKPKAQFEFEGMIKEMRSKKEKRADREYPFMLLPDDDIVHYRDGSISSRLSWGRINCAKPVSLVRD